MTCIQVDNEASNFRNEKPAKGKDEGRRKRKTRKDGGGGRTESARLSSYLVRQRRTAARRPRQPRPETALTSCLALKGSAAHQRDWKEAKGMWWSCKYLPSEWADKTLQDSDRQTDRLGVIHRCLYITSRVQPGANGVCWLNIRVSIKGPNNVLVFLTHKSNISTPPHVRKPHLAAFQLMPACALRWRLTES